MMEWLTDIVVPVLVIVAIGIFVARNMFPADQTSARRYQELIKRQVDLVEHQTGLLERQVIAAERIADALEAKSGADSTNQKPQG